MRSPYAALLLLAACAGAELPPVSPAGDPTLHEVYLIAFAREGLGYLVLERSSDDPLRLMAYDPVGHRRETLADPGWGLSDALQPWPPRAELNAHLRATAAAAEVEARGFAWAEVVAHPEVMGAVVRLDEERVELHDGEDVADLITLPDVESAPPVWLRSADGRRLALELRYAGPVAVQALHVLEPTAALANLWFRRAYEAHRAAAYGEARRLWRQVQAAAPDRPETLYNLACSAARLGEPEAAMADLTRAVQLAPERMRDLARRDQDLASLREREDFLQLIWTVESGDAD